MVESESILTSASPATRELFREAFRHHPAGVSVVTADDGTGPVAMTVTSLVSVSVSPPTVAFSLSDQSSSSPTIRAAGSVIIHFLRSSDLALAELCARHGADRFGDAVNWGRLGTGEPLFTDIGTWFRARIVSELPVHGASLVVAELIEGQVFSEEEQASMASMVYMDRQWHALGATSRIQI